MNDKKAAEILAEFDENQEMFSSRVWKKLTRPFLRVLIDIAQSLTYIERNNRKG